MLIDDIRKGESPTLEFKRDIPDQALKYLKTVSAFANCSGGRIIFGVDSDLSICGMDEPFAARDKIADSIANGIEPTVVPDISFQTVEGKTLIVVEVAQGPRCPYWVKGLGREAGSFIRYDATTRAADADVLRELTYDGSDTGFDMAQCRLVEVTPRKISQLCRRMKAKAVSFCETAAQRRTVHPVTEDKLEEWGVLTRRGGKLVATNAFALLSGDKALSTVVKCGIFRGTEHRKLLDSREFGGPVQDQIDAVHEWLLSKINVAAVIKGVYRHDVYEFPEGALRELVTNAVMHRNYAVYGSDIQVALYDDRLEIISPGGLPRGMTIPRMMSGCSRCRNKAIAEAFAYMHVAEKWGLGIPNVMQEFVGHGLAAPEYTDWGNAVKVTVRRIPKKIDIGPEKSDIGAEKRMPEVGELDIGAGKLDIGAVKLDIDGLPKPTQLNIKAVFKAVGTVEYFKRSDLEPYLELSLTAISNLLESMLKRGLIERVAGHGKGAYRWSRRT